MMSSSPSPKLPQWIFFLTDAVLLFTAWLIANRSTGPLSSSAVYAITACVIAGAVIGVIPLVLRYERVKNETLDDRQRGLEALALTLTTAAEQISIAAAGLHEIAELAQKNLAQAKQVPQVLQDKVTEFSAQLTSARDEERDELKRELAALRAAESAQLTQTAAKVQQAAAELGRLEGGAKQTFAAAQEALAQAPAALTAAAAAALTEIESRLAARTAATLAAIEAATVAAAAETKRTRRPRPEEPAPAELAAPVAVTAPEPAPVAPEVITHIEPVVPPTVAPFADHLIVLTPAPAEPAPDVAPPEPAAAADPAPATPEAPADGAEEPKPVRKRAARKPKPVETPAPSLELGIAEPAAPAPADEFSQVAPDEVAEKVVSSDGATRLLVTAYIGIGNRLFIRGEGPGLSWDKGVPLQFVSIGKWRWESAEAAAPVKFKLYKNDEIECAALGTQRLESGQQQEVTATF